MFKKLSGTVAGVRFIALFFIAISSVALFLSVYIALFWPIEKIMPAYFEEAERFTRGEPLSTFAPAGYPVLISGWLGNVESSMRFLHFMCLLATWAVVCWGFLRTPRLNLDRMGQMPLQKVVWIGFWLLALFWNPYFLIGLVRVSDTAVDIVFVSLLFAIALAAPKASISVWAAAGAVTSLFVLVRPNAATLLIFLAGTAFLARKTILNYVAVIVAFACCYVIISSVTTGVSWFWPGNGGYNLFAGNNPFALAELVGNYNAEYSLDQGLTWCGLSAGTDKATVPDATYMLCTKRFITEYPVEFGKLVFYKLYTMLFRPNLRLANSPAKELMQYIIIAPAVLWWAAFAASQAFRRSLPGLLGVLFIVCYTVPFAFTNADPRFRIPLDIVYIMSALAFALGRDCFLAGQRNTDKVRSDFQTA